MSPEVADHDDHDRDLDELFPVPSPSLSRLSPVGLPGTGIGSLAALRYVLKDNHTRWDIFLNNYKFTNHAIYRALALYALGGSGASIKAFYHADSQGLRPVGDSPGIITTDTFLKHIGDEKYYKAYVAFFVTELNIKGITGTLEEYVFSEKYNIRAAGVTENPPEPLARFVGDIAHALIHVGHGLEFGLKGMLAEGLALTMVGEPDKESLFPPSFFAVVPDVPEEEAKRLSASYAPNGKPVRRVVPMTDDTHVFDIIARILQDDELKLPRVPRSLASLRKAAAQYAGKMCVYAEQWVIDISNPGEIERKLEELIWTSSLLYAIGGYDEVGGFKADFYLMHTITSGLFLHTVVAYLTPRSQALLLRAYLSTMLMWWVVRGRPALNIKSFMETTSAYPTFLTSSSATSSLNDSLKAFLPILESSVHHPDVHVPKIQRALAHFDALYGSRPAGYFGGTGLDGSELLDGSLFARAAVLTMDCMGWTRESQEARSWKL